MEIRTNNVPRDIIHGFELSEKERAEFDWMDWADDGDAIYQTFIRFKGQLFAISEAIQAQHTGWDGIFPSSAFHAVVFKFVNDGESVVVGEIFS